MNQYILNKPGWMNSLERIESKVAMIVGWITTVMFMVVITAIFMQVVCRYFLSLPTPWAEEIARYTWVPTVMLGCAYATFIDHHIEINLIHIFVKRFKTEAGKKKAAKLFYYYKFTVILILAGLYTYLTWHYLSKVIAINQVTSATQIPISLFIAGMFVGFVLTVVHAFIKLITAKYNYNYQEAVEESYDDIDMGELEAVEAKLREEGGDR